MQRTTLVSLGLLTVLLAPVGCGDDKGTSATDNATTGGTDGTGTGTESGTGTTAGTGTTNEQPTTGTGTSASTGTPTTTEGVCEMDMVAPGPNPDGDPCTANADCMSESCIKWTDAQTDAVCGPRPECNNTRFVGTLFDFDTGMPIPMGELRVVGALTALMDPGNATGIVTLTADANGQVDGTTAEPLKEGIGVVGLVGGGDYYVTATGLASPYSGNDYPPLNGIHDIWGVPAAKLTEWSGLLMGDANPDVVAALPLGDNGGVIGLVRQNGAGVAGGVVKSEKADSTALIRYLAEDGMSFTETETGSSGVFVLMNPGLAEKFTVDVGGTPTGLSGTAGSAKNAAFVLIFNVP